MAVLMAGFAGVAARATAQSAALPTERVCDMSAKLVSMRLVDASNTGIGGATVTVRRARTRVALPSAAPMGAGGDYLILEDGQLADLRPDGELFEVTLRKGRRVVRHRLEIGMDAARCHIEVKRGALVVRL
jgi:hypothetical protein